MKRAVVALFGIFLLVALPVGSALADEALFDFRDIVGSEPNTPIRGVPSGGAPWVVEKGEARLDQDGRLRVKVEGLLLTRTGNPALDGTVGPVTGVRASLTCEGSNVVATTATVPLSAEGDAELEEVVTLPSSCFGPIVLVRIGSTATNPNVLGPWIAASGF